jgi:hypothetical protein
MSYSLRLAALSLAILAGATGLSQAALVTYTATLAPEAVGATGTGSTIVDIDTVAHTLRVRASWSGLSGVTTVSHIHAPTAVAFTGNASVATQLPSFTLFPVGVSAGSWDQTLDTSLASSWNPSFITGNGGTALSAEAAFAAYVGQGRSYLNIHSSTFMGGEIRGYLSLIPEPSSALIALIGAGLVMLRLRRAKTAA